MVHGKMKHIVIILFGLLLFQSCSTFEGEKINASTSPKPRPTKDANVTNVENQVKLQQEDLTDVSKLVAKWKGASEKDKELAQKFLNEAKKEFEEKHFTISGQGFLESVSFYPTVEGLVLSGESIINLNIQDQPQEERLKYKISQFKEGLSYFQSAKGFAEKTEQESEIKHFTDLDNRIQCLEASLAKQEANSGNKVCDFITQILKDNKIK
jgi:hypothetical protein